MTATIEIKDHGLEGLTVELVDGLVKIDIPQMHSGEHMIEIMADLCSLYRKGPEASDWYVDVAHPHPIPIAIAGLLVGIGKAMALRGRDLRVGGADQWTVGPQYEINLVEAFRQAEPERRLGRRAQ